MTDASVPQPAQRTVAPVAPLESAHLRLRPVGLDGARITAGPWARWQQDNRDTTTPHAFGWLERDGSVDNLRRLDPGSGVDGPRRGLWFTDSDLYKALEGVAWDLGRADDPGLAALIAEHARIIGNAQEDDGYVNSYVQAGAAERWADMGHGHELYCIGHLIQAGVAHRRATGRPELFEVAVRAADAVVADFGDGRRDDTDGHEEIEMALVELYRETGEPAYLRTAQQLVDVRGHRRLSLDRGFDSDYFQDGTPLREERTVVGHAVRAVYLLAGVVDVYLETGEQALLDAALAQWTSMVDEKTYLTGAVGSRFVGEAFGARFELPPDLMYGETCASIGVLMASWRLLLATGERRFADQIERNLYNLIAASTALDRRGFFYNNPEQRRTALAAAPETGKSVRADAPGTRPAWYDCACCPPNIMRTVASLAAYLATAGDAGVEIHQFMPGVVEVARPDGDVRLEVETEYPADGVVRIRVAATPEAPWTLSLRVPGWAEAPSVAVDGDPVDAAPDDAGYLRLHRAWRAGDLVEYRIPVTPRFTVAHPAVDALRGAVAIERGPVVYAFEDHDQPDGVDLNAVEIDTAATPVEGEPVEIGGVPALALRVAGLSRDDRPWAGGAFAPLGAAPRSLERPVELVAIPYALWANRGPSVMRVFTPAAEPGAR